MKFFFDNNLPPRLAHAIHALIAPDGHQAIHLRDRFPANCSDIEWLNSLANEGDWIIISSDLRIAKNKHERAAWRASRLTAFFLGSSWSKLRFWEKASRLIQRWESIMEQAGKIEPGAGFEVKPHSAKFSQVS